MYLVYLQLKTEVIAGDNICWESDYTEIMFIVSCTGLLYDMFLYMSHKRPVLLTMLGRLAQCIKGGK